MHAVKRIVSCDGEARPGAGIPLGLPERSVPARRRPGAWLGAGVLALALLLGGGPSALALQKEGDRVSPSARAGESVRSVEADSVEVRGPRDREAERIIVQPPRRAFRVSVWTDSPEYFEGDTLRIFFRATQDAYIYVFNTDADGVTRQIFPNYYDRRNRVEGGCTYSLPDRNYSLVVGGPSGSETVEVVAVSDRVKYLDRYEDYHSSEPYPLRSGGREGLLKEVERSNREQREQSESARTPDRDAGARDQAREQDRGGKKVLGIFPVPHRPNRIIVVPEPEPVRTVWAETRFQVLPVRTLPPEGRSAILRFFSSPSGADVSINGAFTGTTPLTVQLPLGRHEIRVTKPGYRASSRSVLINSAFPSSLQFHLQPEYRERIPDPWPAPRPVPQPGPLQWQWGP